MATLKVTFPHYDEEGNWFMAGDFRTVPDHLVEFYLRPSIQLGVVCLAIDESVWTPAGEVKHVDATVNEPIEELGRSEDIELAVAKPAEAEAPEEEEPAPAEDAPAESKKKGRK